MTDTRVSMNKDIMAGVPCIVGTRIPVSAIKSFHEDGYSVQAIKKEYPTLITADIDAAIAYSEAATDELKTMTDLDKHITAVALAMRTYRTSQRHRTIDLDPAGNTYEIEFLVVSDDNTKAFDSEIEANTECARLNARAAILKTLRHVLEREQLIGDSFSVRRIEELIAEFADD